MTRHLVPWTLATAATLSLCGDVWAQGQLPSEQGIAILGADATWGQGTGIAARAPVGQTTGLKLSEATLLHVGVGAEGGYDTNVFYSDENRVASPIVRITPFVQITNATRTGAVPSGAYYDLNAGLQFREYITDNENVRAQRAFNPVASGMLEVSNGRAVSFYATDTFVRAEEPPYDESTTNIIRNANIATLGVRFAPGGGRMRGLVRYTNLIDHFETEEYQVASHMGHDVTLDGSWLWLPKTALFLQVSQGFIHYFDPNAPQDPVNPKFNSVPLRTLAGLRGLLTDKVAVRIAAGYGNAFYQGGGINTTGLSTLGALVELSYRPTLFTNITLGYRHEFRNSVIGTFYDVDTGYLGLGQRIGDRLNLLAHGRYEYRRFAGLRLPRTDNFAQTGLTADFYIQEWLYAGAGYLLLFNRSDVDRSVGGIDYTKQQIFVRLGFVY
jgi:hypothetical protein